MFPQQYPELSEACYELIYSLCADPNTGLPTMRLLRSRSQDFYSKQLKLLPSRLFVENPISQLNSRAWLLKILALELHTEYSTFEHKQQLLSLLYEEEDIQAQEESFMEERERRDQPRMKLLELLDAFQFPLTEPPPVRRTLFTTVDIDSCAYVGFNGVPLIDIKKLHKLLMDEKRRMEFSLSISQQSTMTEEMKLILTHAIQRNTFSQLFYSQCFAFESWKQILEVTLIENYDYLRRTVKEAILYELLEILLQRQNSEDTRVPMATLMSGAVLTLITKLREQKLFMGTTFDGTSIFIRDLPIDSLISIAGGILAGIIRNGTTQLMRGNLYSSLLNFLQFIRKPTVFVSPHPQSEEYQLQMQQIEEFETQQKLLEDGTFSILDVAGEKLVKILCEDASDSSDVWKSVAFSTLDVLLSYDRKHLWMDYIYQRGYLSHYVSSIKNKEEDLFSLLRPNPETLRPLYVYESKFSFLTRIAQSTRGTALLLDSGILRILTVCTFIDNRPEDIIERNEYLPPIVQRYEQLLLPVLRIIDCMLISHPKNEDIAAKILDFVEVHSELLISILKDRSSLTQSSLTILLLTTELFYHLSQHALLMQQKLQTKAIKFEHLMINLLSKYCVREKWQSQVKLDDGDAPMAIEYTTPILRNFDDSRMQKVEDKVLNITRNAIAFCRIMMESPTDRRAGCRVLFTPNIREYEALARAPLTVGTHGRPPSLAIVIHFMKYCVDLYLTTAKEQELNSAKLRNINTLPRDDILEVCLVCT